MRVSTRLLLPRQLSELGTGPVHEEWVHITRSTKRRCRDLDQMPVWIAEWISGRLDSTLNRTTRAIRCDRASVLHATWRLGVRPQPSGFVIDSPSV